MALPIFHPLQEVVVSSSKADYSAASSVMRAPFKGVVKEVGSMLGSVLGTDATITTSIAGTAITGGSFVATASSSAIGDLDAASVSGIVANGVTANSTITGANTCLEGDVIKFAVTGGAASGGPAYFYAVIVRA